MKIEIFIMDHNKQAKKSVEPRGLLAYKPRLSVTLTIIVTKLIVPTSYCSVYSIGEHMFLCCSTCVGLLNMFTEPYCALHCDVT